MVEPTRKEILYFEGTNAKSSANIAQKEEFSHTENARSNNIGTVEKREGMSLYGDSAIATANRNLFYFKNSNSDSSGVYRISDLDGTYRLYYLDVDGDWNQIGTTEFSGDPGDVGLLGFCKAKDNFYLFSRMMGPWCILGSDGISLHQRETLANISENNVYNAPYANLINYYKGRLYAADYSKNVSANTPTFSGAGLNDMTALGVSMADASGRITVTIESTGTPDKFKWKVGNGTETTGVSMTGAYQTLGDTNIAVKFAATTGHTVTNSWIVDYVVGRNVVIRSSYQVGLLGLLNRDADTAEVDLEVTESRYIHTGETLEIRRGGSLIESVIVTAIAEGKITVTRSGSPVALNAADELWVQGTFGSKAKIFRWSNTLDASGVESVTFDTFELSGSPDGGDEVITMMANAGNNMVIASASNLGIWNDFNLRMLDMGIGCISRKGWVKALGGLYFLDKTGIYSIDGETPQLISEKVYPYIKNATLAGLQGAVAGRKDKSIFFCIGDVTLKNIDGSTQKTCPDVCLEYNLITKYWYVHTGIKANLMCSFVGTGTTETLLMATTDTNADTIINPIVEFLASDVYTDILQDIPFRIDTNPIMLGKTFERISYPLELLVESERGSGIRAFVSLDDERFYELEGEATKGVTSFKVIRKELNETQPPRCRNIKVSLRHTEKQGCKISKIAIKYTATDEAEEQKVNETQSQPNI